uniref:Subtilisin-like protease 6-like n=1 Tax=Saccoglossus kowalevskii TaxID=10224 RepID=A0ABM0MTY3_SACKO|nr:PREDICTED: subtilisin-like protease 6-like [Saccoglossus kowalevskii]
MCIHLQQLPGVWYIEETVMVNGSDISWGQDRIDQRLLPLDNTYTPAGDGQGINVYVLDTGIKLSNKYFGNRVNLMYDYDSVKPRKKMCHEHGTHVAGVVGSNIYGVAKGVTLNSVRILNCNNAGTSSNIIAGRY